MAQKGQPARGSSPSNRAVSAANAIKARRKRKGLCEVAGCRNKRPGKEFGPCKTHQTPTG